MRQPTSIVDPLVHLLDCSREGRLDVTGLVKLLFLHDDGTGKCRCLPVTTRLATGDDVCQNGQGYKASCVHRPLMVERSLQLLLHLVSRLGITDLVKEPW